MGGYVKPGTTYKIDEHIEATGKCQTRLWNAGQCQNSTLQIRSIGSSSVYDSSVSSQSPIGYVSPNGNVQLVDTTVPTNTSSVVTFSSTIEGLHAITSKTNFSPTACAFSPSDGVPADNQPLELNVLKCEPKFLNMNGTVVHLGTGVTNIYLPPQMSAAQSALQDAIDQWNAALSGVGVSFALTSNSCGTGPHCISVSSGSVTCGDSGASGFDSNGVITGGATLILRDNWATTMSDSGLRRAFGHELGHFLGLDNYTSSCGVSDAVMQENWICEASNPVYNLQKSDYIPVANSTYGGKTQASCGY